MAFFTYDEKAKPDAFDPLPAGVYTVRITNADSKQTKKGDGEYLAVTLTVIEGEYKNRTIIERYNLVNPSEKAERIGNAQFASLRQAAGITVKLRDTQELVDKSRRFDIYLKCVERSDGQGMENRISRYYTQGESINTPRQESTGPAHKRNAPNTEQNNGNDAEDPGETPW